MPPRGLRCAAGPSAVASAPGGTCMAARLRRRGAKLPALMRPMRVRKPSRSIRPWQSSCTCLREDRRREGEGASAWLQGTGGAARMGLEVGLGVGG